MDLSRRARPIFDAALELAERERAAFVAETCADDPKLRAQVETLLRNHRSTRAQARDNDILRPLVLSSPEQDLSGRRLGRYLLESRLGAGGMGQVYRATQESPHRSVALKFVRRVFASADGLRRFQYEIELLGSLSHPGIAQIYEAGVETLGDEAVPYFAMEYIEDAKSIVEFCAARKLGLRARVELLAAVCDGVHYGHQRGIVHRDLKPANILVDASGAPKVIDFGVAISTNSDVALTTMHTHVGDLLGTLAYMSPEQCEADPSAIDIRSDVYSLGVVLFELVCGRLPYDVASTSIPAATRLIREQAPLRPSTLQRTTRGDLETIVLKALEKDRSKRFASADALGADLRRFLNGERISARPPSLWSRATAWITRHPVLATSAACLAIAFSSLGSVWIAFELAGRRPHEIVVSTDRRTARLNSWLGSVLHEWTASEASGLQSGSIVDRPAVLGGGRVALVGYLRSQRTQSGIGEVVAYDVDRPGVALWGTADTAIERWDPKLLRAEAEFEFAFTRLADVFPASPGDELIVILCFRPYSQMLIRVFDLAGALRYEAWHDGVISSLTWLSSPGLLVLAGVEGQYGLGQRYQRSEVGATSYAPCVLALRPLDGRRESRQWVVRDGARLDPTLAWYQVLGPTEGLIPLGGCFAELRSDLGRHSSDSHLHVQFSFSRAGENVLAYERMPRLHFIVDRDGREVSRYADDCYLGLQGPLALPDPASFRLCAYELLPNPPGVSRAAGGPAGDH